MKHLKTYESTDIKKFYVIEFHYRSVKILHLIKITKIKNDTVSFDVLYVHSYDNIGYIQKHNDSELRLESSIESIEKRTLYKSDNIDDAIEKMKFIIVSNKYNI